LRPGQDWPHEGKCPHHVVQNRARVVLLLFLLVVFSVDFFFLTVFYFPKNEVAK
jgi:hypothetical protein